MTCHRHLTGQVPEYLPREREGEREGGREGGRERERGGGRERERARPFPGFLWGEGLQKYGPLYEASAFSISTSSIAHV